MKVMRKITYVIPAVAILSLVAVVFVSAISLEWKIGFGIAMVVGSFEVRILLRTVPPRKTLMLVGVILLCGWLGFGSTWVTTQVSAERLIKIEARQFGFEPGIIRVNKGDWVNLEITSRDVVHGFYVDGYGIDQKIMPGQTIHIRFKADKPGRFGFRCSETCGAFHPFMVGEIVVQPNYPYGTALGLMGGVAAASILYILWRKEEV